MSDCESEEWRVIQDFKGYEASNLGRIRSIDRIAWNGMVHHKHRGRVLKQQTLRNGYKSVMFSVDGKTTRVMSHRYVALAFIEEDEARACVNHKDGDRSNNLVDNLEWVTHEENIQHGIHYKGDILSIDIGTGDLTLIKGSNDIRRRGMTYTSVSECCRTEGRVYKNQIFKRLKR